MKLRIVSDGLSIGTKVLTEDGQEIEGIRKIEWSVNAGCIAEVSIGLTAMEADIVGETDQYEILDAMAVGDKHEKKILVRKEKP